MTRALKITAVGRTRQVEVHSLNDYQGGVGGFISAVPLGDDYMLILDDERSSNGHPNELAMATVAHLGGSLKQGDVVRGTVFIVRLDASGRWSDVDDSIEREICGLAALLRY
ncbi:DUF3846 domain-containing protein [Microbacterium sp. W4I20]|uniref:DUF3846 domain-containing protein n=1 Tax=Microbacterium sp. W4I20 TaxID=3042262 RepID=UPI002784A610|nr:DUF3846 domain-containing protein [Microbacterium sp. W4I20]MDQ0729178.1 hypothetical protein [Microbacterium sp. W4I20]